MNAGRELDALVAETVMGWPHELAINKHGAVFDDVPNYSTDIEAAWLAVEKLEQHEHQYYLELHGGSEAWYARFVALKAPASGTSEESYATSASCAICLAALKAVGVTCQPS